MKINHKSWTQYLKCQRKYLHSPEFSVHPNQTKQGRSRIQLWEENHKQTINITATSFVLNPSSENNWNIIHILVYIPGSNDHDLDETDTQQHLSSIAPNCTVVYMNQCLSYNKCKENCESMGASSLRWDLTSSFVLFFMNVYFQMVPDRMLWVRRKHMYKLRP